MPRLNGLQVVDMMRKYLQRLNLELQTKNVHVLEPRIVFVTAYYSNAFKQYLKTINIEQCYEKPL